MIETLSVQFYSGLAQFSAIPGAWDITSFLKKGTSSAKGWLQLALVGTGVVVVGVMGFHLARKLLASPQSAQQTMSWAKIIAGILIGGALMTSGFTLLSDVASGGQKTITDLGNGSGGGAVIVSMADQAQTPLS